MNKTIFEAEAAKNWKKDVEEIVDRLNDLLTLIKEKVEEKTASEKVQEWGYFEMQKLGSGLQESFKKLINCIKQALTKLGEIINRMLRAAEDVKNSFMNARQQIKNA